MKLVLKNSRYCSRIRENQVFTDYYMNSWNLKIHNLL